MNMLTRIGSVVGCVFAAAMLARDPSLRSWASFTALVFVYAGHEVAEHRAKREAKRKQESSVQELGDIRLAESALRDESRKKQEIIDEFHKRDREAIVRKMDEVGDVCRNIIGDSGRK